MTANLPPEDRDASPDTLEPPPDDAPPRDDVDLPFDLDTEEPPPSGAELAGVLASPATAAPRAPVTITARPVLGPSGALEAARPAARPNGLAGPAADDHVPPADLQAERAVLSSVMIQNDSLAFAMALTRPEDFYDPRHRHIYAAMIALSQDGDRIEPVTLLTCLRRMGADDKAGGLAYISELSGFSGSSLSIEHYARTVAKMATVRRVLRSVHKVQIEGFKRSVDPDAFVELVQNEVLEALDTLVGTSHVRAGEVVEQVFRQILEARDREGDVVGVPTGFRDLDKMLLGLHPTDLVVLAARPAMGKTALALNVALNVAQQRNKQGPRAGKPCSVMIFSLEMGREQLVQRLLAQKALIGLTQLRSGEISADDEIHLREAAGALHDLELYIDDTPALSPIDVRARAKQVVLGPGLDLVVVDYLQLMRGTGGSRQSREQEISEISRSLKGLAKELNVTVIALSQLNRGVESRADKRPMMSDLRESGAIEQDADVIMFIYRDHVYNKETASPHMAELIVAKHRAGATGRVELHFEGRLTRFGNLDDRFNDAYTGVQPGFG